MKLELIVDKNVILKRDKPWSQFYALDDQALLCFNDQKKFESVDPSNGKIEHVSNRLVAAASKSSLAHCLSNNGQLCAFLSSSFGVTIWDKGKLVRTVPPCSSASKAIKTKSALLMSKMDRARLAGKRQRHTERFERVDDGLFGIDGGLPTDI